MSKHTPGPWTVKKSPCHNGYSVSVAADDHEVSISVFAAYGAREKERQETALANANLVSAAPDMLEALQECLPLFDMVTALDDHGSNALGQAENLIRAAIAKAGGSSV